MLMPCEQYSPYGIYVPGYSRRVTGEPRRYRYVGPADVLATVRRGGEGGSITSPADLAAWPADRGRAELGEPFTFVVDLGGTLRLAPRRSEHVACAAGDPVRGA